MAETQVNDFSGLDYFHNQPKTCLDFDIIIFEKMLYVQ